MKKIFILTSLLISFSVFAKTNPKSDTNSVLTNTNPKSDTNSVLTNTNPKSDTNNDNIKYSKTIIVHGMVCAFCSNNLEKKLKKEEAIDQIKVELTNKKVSVIFKKGKSVEDKKLKEIITSSGFKVVKIESLPNSG